MMKMKTAMVLAAVCVLVSGCAETKSQAGIQGVSAQDPFYMIQGWQYEQDSIGWFTDTESRVNIDPRYKLAKEMAAASPADQKTDASILDP
jgi:hypothetical protein